ncbi:NAD(P)/FAD-dependent oxidoreductase [Streptomyces sp. NPDC003480]
MSEVDVVIVGGGVAGLQTALVLGRSLRSVVVLDGGRPRNAPAEAVHNLAGHEGIAPGELLDRARAHARRYGARIAEVEVAEARRDRGRWRLGEVSARSLVLATGVAEVLPPVRGLAELWGRVAVSCPYCHGWEARGKAIAVVGSGPRAWQQLLLLRRFTSDLTLLSHGPNALDDSRKRLLRAWQIPVHETPIAEITATEVRFTDGDRLKREVYFTATTRRPASHLPAMLGCHVTESGAIATDSQGRTGIPGLWAAGSCADPSLTVAGSIGHATAVAIALNNGMILDETDMA